MKKKNTKNEDLDKTQKYKIKGKKKKTHIKLRKAIKIAFISLIILFIIGAGMLVRTYFRIIW